MHADVLVGSSLCSSPWIKGKHMEQSQYTDKWVQVYLTLDVLSPWSCLCTQIDTLYMVKPNICWFILHGKEEIVAL